MISSQATPRRFVDRISSRLTATALAIALALTPAVGDAILDGVQESLGRSGVDVRQDWGSGHAPRTPGRAQLAPLRGYMASGAFEPPLKAEAMSGKASAQFRNVVLAAEPKPIEHVVKNGDSLSRIAKQYTGDSANWQAIARANQVADAGQIRVGQRLTIPLLPAFLDGRPDAFREAWNGTAPSRRVFVSFARPDIESARSVAAAFRNRGFVTFLYVHHAAEVPAYSVAEVEHFFRSAKNHYVIDTPNARKSSAVALEAAQVHQLGKPKPKPDPKPPLFSESKFATGTCTCTYLKGSPPPTSCDDPRCGPVIPGY